MGWNPFKSKKQTFVSTTVTRAIEDRLLPNSVKAGLIRGLFSNDGQLVEHVVDEMVAGVANKAEQMYRYAKDHYTYGLPTSTIVHSNTGSEIVQGVLEQELETDVTIHYYQFGAFNNLHFGWKTLVDSYGYDEVSNTLEVLSQAKGFPVYLEDMKVVVPEATVGELSNGSLDQWGTGATAGVTPLRRAQVIIPALQEYNLGTQRKPSPVVLDPSAAADYIRVHYIWRKVTQQTVNGRTIEVAEIKREFMDIPVVMGDLESGYFQVKYSYRTLVSRTVDIIGQVTEEYKTHVKYWTYEDGLGTYPEVDAIYSHEFDDFGSFFPIAYYRYGKQPMNRDKNTDAYNTSKKMVKFLGIDFDEMASSIDENPDIEDVEQAMMIMAVPASTENPMEQRYLFDFFKRAYLETGAIGAPLTEQGTQAILEFNKEPPPQTSIMIRDAMFRMTLGFTGIYKKTVTGVIGPRGTYASSSGDITLTKTGLRWNNDIGGEEPATWEERVPFHIFQHQVSDTVYEEVKVTNLSMKYFIWHSHVTVGNEDDPILLIPLDYSITQHYSNRDREILYSRSLHYVFNARVTTKIKWYQQEWFMVVMIVVAIIITVLGDYSGSTMAAVLAGTASMEVIIVALIVAGIEAFIIAQAFKLVVKLIGAEVALVLAIVAMVYGSYGMITSQSGVAGAPWASEMLQVSTGLTKAATDSIGEALLGLKDEAEAFGIQAEEKIELLEQANKLLENQTLLEPWMFFGESPNTFFQRTVHMGNPGVLAIEAVSSYTDIALRLPTIDDTLGRIAR